MAESNYQKQTWKKYDAEKDILTNIAQGGVATSERLNHMEDGIEKANIPYTVGNVTTGPTASVTINDDNSIDFVFPQNTGGGVAGDSGSNFTVSTASPSPENTIAKSDVLNSDDVSEGDLIMCPDGAIYEVITVGADNFTVENKNVSINTGGGKSAYDIWKEQPGNEGKSEEEFLESLKGEPGDAGIQGATGQSAYELWKTQFGNENKSEQDFLDSLKGDKGDPGDVGPTGADGQSAYELWKAQEGNENKTETDFLNALKGAAGEAGEDGQSAYELWKSQPGNENKTEKEFLASLKGEKGDPGQSTGEGGGTMAIGHPTLGDVTVTGEGTNDVKLNVKWTDPTNEGVPYGGMLVAIKDDSYPESPADCDYSADVMTKDQYESTALEIPIPNEKGSSRNLFLTLFPYSSDKVYNMLRREKWTRNIKFFDENSMLEEKEQYSMTSSYNQEDLTPYLASGILASDGNVYFTNRDGNILFKYDTTLKSISVAATLSSDEERNLNKYEEAGITFEYDDVPQNNCTRVAEIDGELYTIVTYAVVGKTALAQTDILKKDGDQLKVFSTSAFQGTYQMDWMLVPLDGKLAIFQYADGTKKMYINIVDPSDKSDKFISKTDININNYNAKSYFASNYVISDDKKSVYVVMRCNMNQYHMVMKITVNYEESSMDCVLIMLPNEDLPKQNVLFVEDDNNIKIYENHSSEKDIVIKYVYVGKDNSTPQSAMEVFRKNDTNIAEYPAQIMRYIGDEVLTAMYSSSDKNSITSVELGSVAKS